jgi:lipopolysaccharide transport system permease protein
MTSKVVGGMAKVRHAGFQRNFENYRDLLIVLLGKELKVRYKNKFLGYLWSVANPLASALVYYIAFKVIMRVEIENYPLMLISGLFPWQWFTNSVGASPNLFVGNASIIKKVSFPRNIIPLCTILNHMIHFVMSIPVILLFLFIYRQTPSWEWLYGMPILLATQTLMVYGIALVFSSINLFFRDLERLVAILLNFAFYFTPVLYPLDLIPDKYQSFVWMNPAAPLIISWRELILNGTFDVKYTAISLTYAIVCFALGNVVYRKLEWKFAEVV